MIKEIHCFGTSFTHGGGFEFHSNLKRENLLKYYKEAPSFLKHIILFKKYFKKIKKDSLIAFLKMASAMAMLDTFMRKNALIDFEDGKKEGKYTNFYENGHKKAEFYMKDGKKEGVEIGFYENGKMKCEFFFSND
jgi:antitoxin component YwqK of YwqJK toxin-antitoxin module